jgi:hypothetical protein
MRAKGEPRVLNTALRYTWDKARTTPNARNRKSLNFQEKVEQKLKVLKRSDVETVETVEAGEETKGAETLSDRKLEGQQLCDANAGIVLRRLISHDKRRIALS